MDAKTLGELTLQETMQKSQRTKEEVLEIFELGLAFYDAALSMDPFQSLFIESIRQLLATHLPSNP